MSKRPPVDLSALTALVADEAVPMREATQRTPKEETTGRGVSQKPVLAKAVKTPDLKPLNFKVPPAFHRRYHTCAFNADLKLNELLFAALDAWEEKHARPN
jgi:hypothetical protein